MKISEIKELASIKFEYKGSMKYQRQSYVLKGMFYKLNSGKSGKPSKFLGYFEGEKRFVTLDVVFTNSDVEETKKSLHNTSIVYMNINGMSGTRFKKEISDYLKKGCKQLRKVYDAEEEIAKLEEKRSKIYSEYRDIDSPTELIEDVVISKKDLLKQTDSVIEKMFLDLLPPLGSHEDFVFDDDDRKSPANLYLEYDHSVHMNYGYTEKERLQLADYIEDTMNSINNSYFIERNRDNINYYRKVIYLDKKLRNLNSKLKSVNIYMGYDISPKGTHMDYYIYPEIKVRILKKNDNLIKELGVVEKFNGSF